MNNGASLGKNTLDLFTKWSEGHLGMLNQRQRMFREATQSVLGIVQDSLEMKAPEESVKKLCGNMLELCNLPLNVVGSNGNWEEYTREFRKLVAGTPIAVSGNGFSEEARAYGKATWENGSRVSSAYVNWMKSLLQGQKLTSDTEEAGVIGEKHFGFVHKMVGRASGTVESETADVQGSERFCSRRSQGIIRDESP